MDCILNKVFDRVYIIHIDERKDRLVHLQNEANKINLNYILFSAWTPKKLNLRDHALNGRIACAMSHATIWEECIKDKVNKVLILEDDFIINNNFTERFSISWMKAPKDWEILNFKCNRSSNVFRSKSMGLKNTNPYWMSFKQVIGLMVVGYTLKGLRKINGYVNTKNIFEILSKGDPFDWYLDCEGFYHNRKSYIPKDEYFTFANIGRSDTEYIKANSY